MKTHTPNLLYFGCSEISVFCLLLQTADFYHFAGSRNGQTFYFCQQMMWTKPHKTSFILDFKMSVVLIVAILISFLLQHSYSVKQWFCFCLISDSLCSKLDQERKARCAPQQKLKVSLWEKGCYSAWPGHRLVLCSHCKNCIILLCDGTGSGLTTLSMV